MLQHEKSPVASTRSGPQPRLSLTRAGLIGLGKESWFLRPPLPASHLTPVMLFQNPLPILGLYTTHRPFPSWLECDKAFEWAPCRCRFSARVLTWLPWSSRTPALWAGASRGTGRPRASPLFPTLSLTADPGSGTSPAEQKLTKPFVRHRQRGRSNSAVSAASRAAQRPNSRLGNHALGVARPAHSCPGNRAARGTFRPHTPPNGRAYVRRLYGGGGLEGPCEPGVRRADLGAAGVTSDLGRGLQGSEPSPGTPLSCSSRPSPRRVTLPHHRRQGTPSCDPVSGIFRNAR
ncbi:hypothetical protein H8959_013308 [Pygathrix nigripes]